MMHVITSGIMSKNNKGLRMYCIVKTTMTFYILAIACSLGRKPNKDITIGKVYYIEFGRSGLTLPKIPIN